MIHWCHVPPRGSKRPEAGHPALRGLEAVLPVLRADASPAEALETAREAAGGKDVRIGGGPTIVRDFLAAGLVDHMHTVVVPILLGRGVRLWDGLEGLQKDYEVEATSSPSGVTHVTFTRAGV